MFQFGLKKFKNTISCRYVISNLNRGEMVGTLYEKDLQKQIKRSLELKKL